MYAVIRRYTGASKLIDELARKRADVEKLMTGVPGFVAYYAARAGDGLTSVTICDDKAGVEESTRRAAGWVRENLPGASMSAPEVTGGEVFLDFKK
jgi:hypothetical protein